MKQFNIIGSRRTFLSISAVFVAAAIVAMAAFHFEEGIDFKGGTLWSFTTGSAPDLVRIGETIRSVSKKEDVRVSSDPVTGTVLARMPDIDEDAHRALVASFKGSYPGFEESSFQSIGPSVGKALRTKALIALVLVLVGISLYIAFAFRKVYRPVSSWKYGMITLLTLLHDVAIPAGLLAILGRYQNVEIDTNFLVALLVVMGFSVHDTIVVFDRIRENLLKERSKKDFKEIVNESVNQTLGRSVNTSLTLILVLLALYFAGPPTLKYFVLTLLVGVTTGIYSSIFVASPLLIVWQGKSEKNKK